MGNYSSAFTADIEDFKAIVSSGSPAHSSDGRRHGTFRRSQSEILLSSSQSQFSDPFPPVTPCDELEKPEPEETNGPDILSLKFLNVVDAPAANASASRTSMSAPPTPTSVGLDVRQGGRSNATVTPSRPARPCPRPCFLGRLAVLHHPQTALRVTPSGSPVLDQLKLQLREMKDDLELLKSQHKKEVTLLMSELDEEKKIRLSLQVEVDKIKKKLSKSS